MGADGRGSEFEGGVGDSGLLSPGEKGGGYKKRVCFLVLVF